MIKVIFFFFTILTTMGCATNTNMYTDMSLKTVSQSTESKPIKNLLIIGGGSARVRIFLDQLSQEISDVFNSAKIKTESFIIEDELSVDTLNYEKYDAFLLFSSKDAAWDNRARKHFRFYDGNVTTYKVDNKLDGTLKLELYQQMEDSIGNIWQGDLKLDFEMSKESRYKKMAKLIYSELQKKKIITDK